jgi:molybdopterin-binding protein
MISAHNQFKGIIKSVKLGLVTAEIVISVGDFEVVSMIRCTSA